MCYKSPIEVKINHTQSTKNKNRKEKQISFQYYCKNINQIITLVEVLIVVRINGFNVFKILFSALNFFSFRHLGRY